MKSFCGTGQKPTALRLRAISQNQYRVLKRIYNLAQCSLVLIALTFLLWGTSWIQIALGVYIAMVIALGAYLRGIKTVIVVGTFDDRSGISVSKGKVVVSGHHSDEPK
jgi:hypothetical protein